MATHDDLTYNKPRTTWRRYWLKYGFNIICYFALMVAILIVYHFFSDGDFSFLMTLGSLFVLSSFVLLLVKVVVNRNVAGTSLKTLQAYALVFAARLSSILLYEGYLPYDRSGDWFYQATEVLALLLVVALLIAVVFPFNRSYGRGADSFGAKYIPSELGVLYIVVPALLLAIVLHPSLNGNWFTDTAWTFALYLEAVAILPQLYMFQKAVEKEVEPFTANFVFLVAVARMLHFVFWLSSFHELNDKYASHISAKYPGHLVLLSQLVNFVLMGDYIYYYMVSARSGKPVLLPQTI